MERLRRLSVLPQARLDMNFVHLVGELQSGIEALFLTITHAKVDQEITLEKDLQKSWRTYNLLMMQVALHISTNATEIETRLRQLLAIE